MPKVYVEGSNHLIVEMFALNDWGICASVEEADLVCFEGGADVSPELYGEVNTASNSSRERDWSSLVLYNNAKRLQIPMVGICRGAQFLNVMAGGKMIQHVEGHAIHGTHEIVVTDVYGGGKTYQVTSTHHQMMVVNTTVSEFIGWANKDDAEIAFHFQEAINGSLSFQPHPEYVDKGHECQTLFFDLLSEYFDLEV